MVRLFLRGTTAKKNPKTIPSLYPAFLHGEPATLKTRNSTDVSSLQVRAKGGVSVARFASHPERPEAARLLFSWSCEDNYHVEHHRTNIPDTVPVLNLMSAEDKFFSRANAYLGNDDALGHAGKTLAKHSDATIVLLPGAPHTLFNLPAARRMLRGFLEGVLPL